MFPRLRMAMVLAAASFLFLTARGGTPDVNAWVDAAFDGVATPNAPKVLSLTVRKQDYGHLEMNRSVMGTAMRIGQRRWERGLGTHANSDILVVFPAGAAKEFSAMVGVDSEAGTQGSVQFMVEIGGKEVFRSRTVRGSEEAVPVQVPIPPDAGRIVLKVDTTLDGPAFDHADWAEAKLIMADGSTVWLDELAAQSEGDFWPTGATPFSFVYGGISSEKLLPGWTREITTNRLADRIVREVRWTDPKTALKVTATVTVFDDFPAAEWVLRFENGGATDSPILENVQALDATLHGSPGHDLTLDQINGDDASERSYVPSERALAAGQSVALAPVGGRPSNGTFPMFNLQESGRGFFTAIGWTGQWAASLQRDPAGQTRLKAGMELTHLLLHPGESIRSPRILLMAWSGDRMDAHNQFRHLLLAHYLPKIDGKLPDIAVSAQSFNEGPPGWATEAGQLKCVKINRDWGCDTLWMDAGWFKGDFPNGVGNWIPKAKEFPNGLAPIGEACENAGLKFLVWYEPERVADNSEIAVDHAEFVLPVNKKAGAGGLFNLGDPAARRWLTDLLVRQIAEFHIHTYRNDFNMDPLAYWRQNDAPDRQGISEIRYVEGLYAMWDEMRAKYPRMYMDDCASGGRRIDLEMVSRSFVQTESDAAVAPGRADWDQSQNYGLGLFLPVHATIGWEVGAYECRSAATQGFCAEWNILDPHFPRDEAEACLAEINANRKYWSGDYYPLTPWTMSPGLWMAWQLHRPDLDEGIVLAFRHEDCPYAALQASLRGIKPDKIYNVEFIDEHHHVTTEKIPGEKLVALELKIPNTHQSLLVRYGL